MQTSENIAVISHSVQIVSLQNSSEIIFNGLINQTQRGFDCVFSNLFSIWPNCTVGGYTVQVWLYILNNSFKHLY